MFVFDACRLGGVVGGGKVFAKIETFFGLGAFFLEVLGEAFRF